MNLHTIIYETSARLDCPAFLRLSETGQTKRRIMQTYPVSHSTGFLKPRSTPPSSVHATPDPLRFAAGFRTPVQCD